MCISQLHANNVLWLTSKFFSPKKRLTRLSEIVQHDCPELNEVIQSSDAKPGHHAGIIMTDSCNATQKARHLLQHKIGGIIYELDCHHHMHNVWIKGMEQSISNFMHVVISDSLEKIPIPPDHHNSWKQVPQMGLVTHVTPYYNYKQNYVQITSIHVGIRY